MVHGNVCLDKVRLFRYHQKVVHSSRENGLSIFGGKKTSRLTFFNKKTTLLIFLSSALTTCTRLSLYSIFGQYTFYFLSKQISSISFHVLPVQKFVKIGMPWTTETYGDPRGHNGKP